MSRYRYEPSDYEQISQYLALAAELSSSRPMSAAAVKHLIGLLAEEVPAIAAITVLRDWPKRHTGVPALREILREARDLIDRQRERKAEAAKATAPAIADIKPQDPAMADAVDRCLKAINSMPARPRDFWELEGIANIENISLLKRRYLEDKYGERLQDPSFISSVREKVRARLQIEAAIPKPSDFVAPVRADAWEFGA